MARLKENEYVQCDCPKCNGKAIDPSVWYRHNGHVTGDISWMAKDLIALKEIWGRGERLVDLMESLENL
jgi:hypothetical protein